MASHKAQEHGFRVASRIYFAVDYDAMDHEVSSHILPYFQGVYDQMAKMGNLYKIGIYGPRNVCSRVSAQGYAGASFVSNMSSGFSGNLGYPMPENWAFDQIATKMIGSGAGAIEIDNNIASGRDIGQGEFDPPPVQKLDVGISLSIADDLASEAINIEVAADVFVSSVLQRLRAIRRNHRNSVASLPLARLVTIGYEQGGPGLEIRFTCDRKFQERL